MNISDELNFVNVPEYIIDNMWTIFIDDGPSFDNQVKFKERFGDYSLDNYICDINVPDEELEFEKNSFGLGNYKNANKFESISISFYDDLQGRMSKFFQDWMDSIYDMRTRRVKLNWRKQKKDIEVSLIRYINKGSVLSNKYSQNTLFDVVDKITFGHTDVVSKLTNGNYNVDKNYDNIEKIKSIIYNMKTCYPVSLESISLSDNGGDRMKFTVKLECEIVEKTFGE